MRLSRLIRSACVWGVLLRGNISFAQAGEPVELTWEAPENCPREAQVQQQLRALIGSNNETTSPLQAHGTIETIDRRYRLTLFIERRAAHGTRIIESEDCRSLGKAAAVVLGLLVQKERALGRELSESEISGHPQPEIPTTPPPVKEAPPVAAPNPKPLPPRTEPPHPGHFLLRGPEASVNYMTLPKLGFGIGLGAGVKYNAWRVLVAGAFYELQNQSSVGFDRYQVEYRRRTLELLGCHGWRTGLFELAPCGLLAADAVFAHASGDNLKSQDQGAYWISIGGGISGYLHLQRHFALLISGFGRIATDRIRFLVGTSPWLGPNQASTAQAHRVPLGTFDASIAGEWIF